MARWLVGGIGALLLVVLFILWNDADRAERSSVDRAKATNDIPLKNTEEKSTPKIAKHLTAPVASNRTAANQKTANESETEQKQKTIKVTTPERTGPLKALKRFYEDESRDAKANKIEKQIRDEFGSEYLPVELLRNVVCHKSVCKVEMYWSEKNPLGLMVLSLKMAATLTGYVAFDPEPKPDRDGRTLVAVYALREGDISER